jgi:hypothetical protein
VNPIISTTEHTEQKKFRPELRHFPGDVHIIKTLQVKCNHTKSVIPACRESFLSHSNIGERFRIPKHREQASRNDRAENRSTWVRLFISSVNSKYNKSFLNDLREYFLQYMGDRTGGTEDICAIY